MNSHARVVVIGGGVVGCSVLYHLTKLGWSDVLLIERSELTSGSTWHAAGGFHTLNGDTNMAALQGYTIGLYDELEKITGMSCGLHHVGGLHLAESPERLDMMKAERGKHRYMGLHTEILTPDEIKEKAEFVNTDGILGALYDPLDGHLDPSGTTHAYAKAARMGGAEIVIQNRVLGNQPARGRVLGGGDREGHGDRRTCGQRRRSLGARGCGHGGALPAASADGASVHGDGRHPRDLQP